MLPKKIPGPDQRPDRWHHRRRRSLPLKMLSFTVTSLELLRCRRRISAEFPVNQLPFTVKVPLSVVDALAVGGAVLPVKVLLVTATVSSL